MRPERKMPKAVMNAAILLWEECGVDFNSSSLDEAVMFSSPKQVEKELKKLTTCIKTIRTWNSKKAKKTKK